MKYQILCSAKNNKNIINLSSAELAQSVVKVKQVRNSTKKLIHYYQLVNLVLTVLNCIPTSLKFIKNHSPQNNKLSRALFEANKYIVKAPNKIAVGDILIIF